MSYRCHKCNELLPPSFYASDTQNAWHMENAAPHAASGGTMVPMHDRCSTLPLFVGRTFDGYTQSDAGSKVIITPKAG